MIIFVYINNYHNKCHNIIYFKFKDLGSELMLWFETRLYGYIVTNPYKTVKLWKNIKINCVGPLHHGFAQ